MTFLTGTSILRRDKGYTYFQTRSDLLNLPENSHKSCRSLRFWKFTEMFMNFAVNIEKSCLSAAAGKSSGSSRVFRAVLCKCWPPQHLGSSREVHGVLKSARGLMRKSCNRKGLQSSRKFIIDPLRGLGEPVNRAPSTPLREHRAVSNISHKH